MSGWGGFTDEELRRMKNEATDGPRKPRPQGRGGGGERITGHKQAGLQAGKNPSRMKPKVQSPTHAVDLPADQRLSIPKPKPQTNKARTQDSEQTVNKSITEEPVPEKQNMPAEEAKPKQEEEKLEKEAVELDEGEVAKIGRTNLQKFQEQQKQMEELNKQKRAMLATAIQQRRKRAVAEASKLNKLHKELDKLDDLLTEDVSKIRDKIEEASREYLDAQKRYERAEKEFIEAKIDLHQKEELKESLTEHLYTVIHHNEVRKSKKLAELMGALDIEEAAELAEMVNLPEIPVMLPQASYIKGPKSPGSVTAEGHKDTTKNEEQREEKTEGKKDQNEEKKDQMDTKSHEHKDTTHKDTDASKAQDATKDTNIPKDTPETVAPDSTTPGAETGDGPQVKTHAVPNPESKKVENNNEKAAPAEKPQINAVSC